MITIADKPGIEPALKAQMEQLCDRIAKGIFPSMEERRASAARMDRLREENTRLFGVQDVTLNAVRESRNNQ